MSTITTPVPIDNLLVEENLSIHQLQYHTQQKTLATNETLILTVDSEVVQVLNGTNLGGAVQLPNATTLIADSGATTGMWHYILINNTNQTKDIKYNDGTLLAVLAQNSFMYLYCNSIATTNGVWFAWQVLSSSVASGIINYNLTSATPFTTSVRNPTFAVITGFTLTPQAGTYFCIYNASVFYTTTPKAHFWAFYKNGAQVTDSLRQQDTAHSSQTMVDSTQSIISFNGTDTIDVRVSCDNTGSLTVNARSILLIRIGT